MGLYLHSSGDGMIQRRSFERRALRGSFRNSHSHSDYCYIVRIDCTLEEVVGVTILLVLGPVLVDILRLVVHNSVEGIDQPELGKQLEPELGGCIRIH